MIHTFPELPYAYNALEPYIDAHTMEVHYSKHHKTYFDKFVAAIEGTPLADQSLEEIFATISSHSPTVRNNGGGYYNHILYWQCMSPTPKTSPTGPLLEKLLDIFGGLEAFKDQFSQAAVTTFGSGFVWLVASPTGTLEIVTTPNQDNPLMDTVSANGTPILALDVWEHAYYIRYQNRRPDYINAWWHVVDWQVVENRYHQAINA